MIRLPGYAAVVDKEAADLARANIREAGVERDVKVEEKRAIVIGADEVNRRYLVIMADGKSAFYDFGRVTFALEGPKGKRVLVEG